jgi:probable HAF family extracellular repeat protein
MRLLWFSVAPACCAALTAFAQAPHYQLTPLGTLGGTSSYAYGINDSGEVVGGAYNASGFEHAFTYIGGTMTDLGAAGSPYGSSTAYGINSSGIIVGQLLTRLDGPAQPFSYSGGTMTPFAPGMFADGGAYGINSSGLIVGSVDYSSFSYSGGTLNVLGTLNPIATYSYVSFSYAYGVNDSGLVVGAAYGNNGQLHAFAYSGGMMTDLGDGAAYGVNDSGVVVGQDGVGEHAFSYSNGMMTDLGTLGGRLSEAKGINNLGVVVGDSWTANGNTEAFVDVGGSMLNLNNLVNNDAGWDLQYANAINSSGQIVGYGIDPLGHSEAYLLTPTAAQPVPEAGTWGAGLVVAGLIVGHCWRRALNLCPADQIPAATARMKRAVFAPVPTALGAPGAPGSI